ncbi:MAG: hypothetical protein ACM3JB_22720 [Acidobacteriaceae bacterium]
MKNPPTTEPELAGGWSISRVRLALDCADKVSLTTFLAKRYEERFFEPIQRLRLSPGHYHGYGFAIMALCSLLVESLQCYRDGLPTTHDGEYRGLASFSPPAEYDVPAAERKNGLEAFKRFFAVPQNRNLFPDVDGEVFYRAIRNGILHQAQTKNGWRIRTGQAKLWNSVEKVLDRDKFADATASAFKKYIEELEAADWNDQIWTKARRKIWWLIQLSS